MKDDNIYMNIKKDPQIWKFGFYGLFKNLKFFEPYLYIYFLSFGINLFQIGILFSIRESITYIFEIPSGIFADHYGKITELLICFTFYIISFIFFFIGEKYSILIIGMIFFGLGESFRSGTHKAMIYSYLEKKGWFSYKTFVYGRTRSFSLIGSSLSAFISIIFVLNLPGLRWLFLIAIIPYTLDFILIATYPGYLNDKIESDKSFKKFIKNSIMQLKSIWRKKQLRKVLLSSSLYDAIFKTIKDYIQPIMKMLVVASGIGILAKYPPKSQIIIVLGVIYGVFYIFSSIASRNVFRLNRYFSSCKLMNLFFDIMGITLFVMFFIIKSNLIIPIIVLFFILYLLKDARRPLVVDVAGDIMDRRERATVMSIDSQLKSLVMIILAPLVGLVADQFSIGIAFLSIGVFIIIVNSVFRSIKMDKY